MKEIILNVDGMMCSGCENRVQNALKTIKGVKEVKASHEEKKVQIILKQDVDEQIFKDKIADLGYEVIE
ncbi:MAG: heavy-metal-associated domain-containing protein [Clostridia bacterium]|nr:heavy-metal-associated domain-containing protein [Clostridia bacterium]